MMDPKMQLLVKTAQELSLARDIDTIMKIVRTTARNLTSADGASFVLRDRDLCFYADEDAIGPLWKGQRFPMTACISGWTMINKQPAAIEDIYLDPRIPVEAYKSTFVKSLVTVPIRTIDPIGAIGNYWGEKHLPTDEEVGLLQALADITSVTMENVKVYRELEQRVIERTRQLEMANKELEAFSYSVSHDLQAPLRVINNYIDVLVTEYADKFDEEGIKLTSRITKNVDSMSQLIEDLLDFFKTGRNTIESSEIKMKDMVTEICNDFKKAFPNLIIEFQIDELPVSLGDYALIKQVWSNLISNAIKYSSKKEKSIITIGYITNDNKPVYFVKDNGAGFNMENSKKLFGVFQRLHSASQFNGSRIGLAITDKIIAKHGGRIWAEAKENEGATFYFTL